MDIKGLLTLLESIAPLGNAEDFDNVGLLIGDENAEVRGISITLDVTEETLKEAMEKGANVILSHHPVIFHPIKKLTANTLAYKIARAGIHVISLHTNLDRSIRGVNWTLAKVLGLENPLPMEEIREEQLDFGYGCISKLTTPLSCEAVATMVKEKLGCPALRCNMIDEPIHTIAVVGGSGGSMLKAAYKAGANCLLTGDIKHDQFFTATEMGMMLIDGGHYYTEAPIVHTLKEILEPYFPPEQLSISTKHKPPFMTF